VQQAVPRSPVAKQLLGVELDWTAVRRRAAELPPPAEVEPPPLPAVLISAEGEEASKVAAAAFAPSPASPAFPEPPAPELQPLIAAFRRNGFVHLPGLLAGEELAAVQASFAREKPASRARFEGLITDAAAAAVAQERSGYSFVTDKFYDVTTDVGSEPEVWLPVIAAPRLAALAEELVGKGAQCTGLHGRVVPPDPTGLGYATWHRDFERTAVALHTDGPVVPPCQLAEAVKCFLLVSDQTEEMGCTSVRPGSHVSPHEPRSQEWRWPGRKR
jgi:hypothetical protein